MSQTPPKGQIRADEYRARAEAASALADAAPLALVKERHAIAAATWFRMAESEDQRLQAARILRERL